MDLRKLARLPPWDWPEGTDEKILAVLRDPASKEEQRLIATELAGDYTVINDSLAEALLSILGSGGASEELRGRSAISFGAALEHSDTNAFDDPDDAVISEEMFHRIQRSLQKLHSDADVPKYVRRRILEAAVRAPQEWQRGAIRVAYNSGDRDWKLTAVFCMNFVRGFDEEIVDALDSEDPMIHLHAVQAAGTWEIEGAWPHLTALVRSGRTEKDLLLAAIEAVASVRPSEAQEVLADLVDSKDEDIAEAVLEALAMADMDDYDDLDDAYEDEDEDDDDDEPTR